MTATVPAGRAADHFDYLEDPTSDTAQAAVLEAWAAEVRSATFQLLAQKSAVDSPDQAPQYRARLEGALAARTVMLRALVHGAPVGIPTAVLADAREALAAASAEDEPGPSRTLSLWNDAVSEQTHRLASVMAELADARTASPDWQITCRDFVTIEIASLVGLLVAAPAGVFQALEAGAVLTEARGALAESGVA